MMETENEMLEPLREIFGRLSDKDGLIKVEQFVDLACERVGVSREQAGELSSHLDPFGKGVISLNDICQMSMQQLSGTPESSHDTDSFLNQNGTFEEVDGDVLVEGSPRPMLSLIGNGHHQRMSSAVSDPISLGEMSPDAGEFEGSGEADEPFPRSGAMSPGSAYSFRLTSPRKSRSQSAHGSAVASRDVSSDEENDERETRLTGLLQQVSELNDKLIVVQEERDNSTSQQKRIKREYSNMKERLHLLEEQLQDAETKRQATLRKAEERQKMKIAHMENRKAQQLETLRAQLAQTEETVTQLQATDSTLRQQLKDAKEALTAKTEQSEELTQQLRKKTSELRFLQEQQRREKEGAAATVAQLEQQVEEANSRAEGLQQQCEELRAAQKVKAQDEKLMNNTEFLEQDVARLQKEVNRLRDRNDQLSGQLIQQGKMLMDTGEREESLAAELEVKSKDEIMLSLQEEKAHSERLLQYISHLLEVVVEKSPHLLEIKPTRKKA